MFTFRAIVLIIEEISQFPKYLGSPVCSKSFPVASKSSNILGESTHASLTIIQGFSKSVPDHKSKTFTSQEFMF